MPRSFAHRHLCLILRRPRWLFSPKGTGFLWVTPEWQAQMVPPTLSGCRGDFVCTFEYTGTRDYAPFATVSACSDTTAATASYDRSPNLLAACAFVCVCMLGCGHCQLLKLLSTLT